MYYVCSCAFVSASLFLFFWPVLFDELNKGGSTRSHNYFRGMYQGSQSAAEANFDQHVGRRRENFFKLPFWDMHTS
jgi:hypothetical protein